MIDIFENEIDKTAKTPVYKQIVNVVRRGVMSGDLSSGNGLPPERELAQALDIARGTVKKAYEELFYKGVVDTVQGRGTFIKPGAQVVLERQENGRQAVAANPDKNIAGVMQKAVSELSHSFSDEEIKAFFFNSITESKTLKIAAIDCNAESLKISIKQLDYIGGAVYMDFLISAVKRFKNPEATFNEFDILFTTATHYDEIFSLLGETGKKLIKLAISPDKETVFKIASLDKNSKPSYIGIISKSARFSEIIRKNLDSFGILLAPENAILQSDLTTESFSEFIKGKKAVIMPPLYTLDLKNEIYDKLFEFHQKGGLRLTFNYAIEQGSLIYMEEIARNLKSLKEAAN